MANKKVKIILGISVVLIAGGALFYKLHPHDYVLVDTKEPTCTEDGYNNYRCWCGTESKEALEAIGHDYQEEIIEATCTDEGKEVYTCSNCGDTYENSIKATGHNYKEEITVEPTCTEEGVDTFTCNNCGDVYTEAIAPLGHSYIDGICERCGELSEEAKKKQEESKKKESGGGSGNGGGSSSQKPSGNSGQTGNNVSNETPTNDTSAGAAAWGFGGGSVDTSDWSTRGGGTGAHAE